MTYQKRLSTVLTNLDAHNFDDLLYHYKNVLKMDITPSTLLRILILNAIRQIQSNNKYVKK